MKIGIVSGSHRKQSQSLKVAGFIEQLLLQNKQVDTWLYSLSGNPLPLWDEGVWDNEPQWLARLEPLKAQFSDCEGFVIVTPEWHGTVPAGLKNLFLLLTKIELGHKPALIVSVSSGRGGAYPVAELRMSSYKNNRLCYIPEQVIIREVENVLNENEEKNDARSDRFYRERLSWALDILLLYSQALIQVRESGIVHSKVFKTGM